MNSLVMLTTPLMHVHVYRVIRVRRALSAPRVFCLISLLYLLSYFITQRLIWSSYCDMRSLIYSTYYMNVAQTQGILWRDSVCLICTLPLYRQIINLLTIKKIHSQRSPHKWGKWEFKFPSVPSTWLMGKMEIKLVLTGCSFVIHKENVALTTK